ncbi:hypothetical protein QR66_15260 [Chromobacterium piscinae]|nr:hypothetical protein QR66_15260 [Chromobacterium piscinae]
MGAKSGFEMAKARALRRASGYGLSQCRAEMALNRFLPSGWGKMLVRLRLGGEQECCFICYG